MGYYAIVIIRNPHNSVGNYLGRSIRYLAKGWRVTAAFHKALGFVLSVATRT